MTQHHKLEKSESFVFSGLPKIHAIGSVWRPYVSKNNWVIRCVDKEWFSEVSETVLRQGKLDCCLSPWHSTKGALKVGAGATGLQPPTIKSKF